MEVMNILERTYTFYGIVKKLFWGAFSLIETHELKFGERRMIMFKPFIRPTFIFVLKRCILFVAHSLVSHKHKMALMELGEFLSTRSQHRLASGEPTTVLEALSYKNTEL